MASQISGRGTACRARATRNIKTWLDGRPPVPLHKMKNMFTIKCALIWTGIIVLASCASISMAQNFGIASDDPELTNLRAQQRNLAIESGITINHRDVGQRSSSNIDGVPFEFGNLEIRGADDLLASIDKLYPYYGFSGTETLKYEDQRNWMGETGYSFREYINNIQTPYILTIWIDPELNQIKRFIGSLVIDRGFEVTPLISEQEAITRVINSLQQQDSEFDSRYVIDGNHSAEVVYRQWGRDWALEPFWKIGIERDAQSDIPIYRDFLVDPEGSVINPGGIDY